MVTHANLSRHNARSNPMVESSAVARSLEDCSLFCNREISLLEFQRRVLQEAEDAENPLLERLNFLSILGSNLDEFFMVRVAVLKQRVASGGAEAGIDGLTGPEVLDQIRASVLQLTKEAYKCLRHDLRPALEHAGIRIVDYRDLDDEAQEIVDRYF